jgi:uncharacterized membrane protein
MGSIVISLFLIYIYSKYRNEIPNNTITITFTLLFSTFLVGWYMYNSSSSALYTIIQILMNMWNTFSSEFLNPNLAQGIYIINKQMPSPLKELYKYLHIFSQVCISTGLVYTIIKNKSHESLKFKVEYLSLSIVFFMILLIAIVVPNFSSALNTSRLYQITLILLAPFCVIGGTILFKQLLFFVDHNQFWMQKTTILSLKILSIFFLIFLLFNTGWIYEMANDESKTSYSLSSIDYPKFNHQDVLGKEWLCNVNNINTTNGRCIYADGYRLLLFLTSFDAENLLNLGNVEQISKSSYIYFSTYNTVENKILIVKANGVNSKIGYVNCNEYISFKNKIYDNHGSIIYYSQ